MTISSVGTTTPLLGKLQVNGLPKAETKLAQSEIDAATKDVTASTGAASAKPDAAAVRAGGKNGR